MSDVVERAKAALVDYEVAKGSLVAVAPGRSYRLLAELVAEVERLRAEKLGLEISESNLLVELRNDLRRHEFVPASFIAYPKPAHCACGEWCDSGRWQPRVRNNFLEHFAEEIDKALGGLTRETVPARWVSGWGEA